MLLLLLLHQQLLLLLLLLPLPLLLLLLCFTVPVYRSGSFLKREGRPRDDDVLVARLVDRPIRPMFDKGWCNETQVCRSSGTAAACGCWTSQAFVM